MVVNIHICKYLPPQVVKLAPQTVIAVASMGLFSAFDSMQEVREEAKGR